MYLDLARALRYRRLAHLFLTCVFTFLSYLDSQMCGRSAVHAENDHKERGRFGVALNAMYPGADDVVDVVFGPARDGERTRHVNSARALHCGPRQCGRGRTRKYTGDRRDASTRHIVEVTPTGGALRPKQHN